MMQQGTEPSGQGTPSNDGVNLSYFWAPSESPGTTSRPMKNIGDLVFPALLIILGLVLLIIGAQQGQNTWMMTGSGLAFLTGVIMLLSQFGIITRKVGVMLGAVAGVGVAALAYRNVRGVQEVLEFNALKKESDTKVIQGLKDIRTAQLGYRQTYGAFTGDLEVLKDFVKNGQIPMIRSVGMVPDTLTERDALELGIIVRDTLLVAPLDSLYGTRRALEGRAYPFDVESFVKSPVSGEKWILRAGVISSSGRNVPVFVAKDPKPLVAGDTLMVGNLEKASTAGNWSGE